MHPIVVPIIQSLPYLETFSISLLGAVGVSKFARPLFRTSSLLLPALFLKFFGGSRNEPPKNTFGGGAGGGSPKLGPVGKASLFIYIISKLLSALAYTSSVAFAVFTQTMGGVWSLIIGAIGIGITLLIDERGAKRKKAFKKLAIFGWGCMGVAVLLFLSGLFVEKRKIDAEKAQKQQAEMLKEIEKNSILYF